MPKKNQRTARVQRSVNDRRVVNTLHKLPFGLLLIIAVALASFLGYTFIRERGNSSAFSPPLWSANFEDGNYKFGANVLSGSGNVSVTNDGHGGGKAVRIFHPKGQYYGAAWYPRFSGNLGIAPQEDVYFRYYIKPDPNYHFRLEAKIPGLAGNTGDNYFPSGCDPTDSSRGWSGRLQWGLGPNYGYKKGRIQTYLYVGHPASNTGGCGFKAEWAAGAELEQGKWACIEVRYKMNTPGQRNGIMQGWFNGVKKYERSDILYRNNTAIKSNMLANVFYHGGTSAWQPIQDQYVTYDKLAISNQQIGCGTTETPQPTPTPAPTPAPSPTPTPAPSPTPTYDFTVDGTTMKWNAVPGASAYKVYLADTKQYIRLSADTLHYDVPRPSTGTSRQVGWTWYDGRDHWTAQQTVYFSQQESPVPVFLSEEAETSSLCVFNRQDRSCGSLLSPDRLANKGQAIRLAHNGDSVSKTFTVSTQQTYRPGFVLRSQDYRGSAYVNVYLNNVLVMKNVGINGLEYRHYYHQRSLNPGQYTLKVVFINDKCGNSSPYERCDSTHDRNLLVDRWMLISL